MPTRHCRVLDVSGAYVSSNWSSARLEMGRCAIRIAHKTRAGLSIIIIIIIIIKSERHDNVIV